MKRFIYTIILVFTVILSFTSCNNEKMYIVNNGGYWDTLYIHEYEQNREIKYKFEYHRGNGDIYIIESPIEAYNPNFDDNKLGPLEKYQYIDRRIFITEGAIDLIMEDNDVSNSDKEYIKKAYKEILLKKYLSTPERSIRKCIEDMKYYENEIKFIKEKNKNEECDQFEIESDNWTIEHDNKEYNKAKGLLDFWMKQYPDIDTAKIMIDE